MFKTFEDVQKMGKDQVEAATAAAATWTKGVQEIAAQTSDYSKRSLEQTQGYVEKLLGVKTLDKAFEVQSEFARQAYEGMVAQSTKVGEIYGKLVKDTFAPVEQALAKAKVAK